MEQLAELNHSILSKLPLGIQSILKSLPLSDFSILILAAVTLSGFVYLVSSYGSTTLQTTPEEFGDYTRPKKEVQVKVSVAIPKKKVRRSKKRQVSQVVEEVKEERKIEHTENTLQEEGWETVQAKKPKRKNE